MSVCMFLASDCPLKQFSPSKEYPLEINIDNGIICDGGADDNFYLNNFEDVQSYTDKKFGVSLEWNYTDGRAKRLIEYINDSFENTDSIELWKVWLTDYFEYDESPVIQKRTISASDLSVDDIKKINTADIWNTPDKRYPNRPSFYRLIIKRSLV